MDNGKIQGPINLLMLSCNDCNCT